MWRASRGCIFSLNASMRLYRVSLQSSRLRASSRGLATSKQRLAAEFELLVPAVQTFHAKFGHFLVPYSFPIALDDVQWPEETRGVNIGRRLHAFMTNVRHQKQSPLVLDRLGAVGFPVDTDFRQLVWEKKTLAALRAYLQLHGDSLVPVGFVVPSPSADFPVETWGFELGKRVAKLREGADRLSEAERRDLETVAFSFDVDATHWATKILPALQAFKRIHGHSFVKREFVVPSGRSDWPDATWGLRIGLVVHNVRCHGAYKEFVQRDWETLRRDGWIHLSRSPEDEWNTVVLPALRHFHVVHGHGLVPATFVVPAEDPWPRGAWGFCLGQLVHTSHSLNIYEDQLERDKQILHNLGAAWFASLDDKWDRLIKPALEVYVEVYGTENTMPQRFVVPAESPWPQRAWGLRLGEMVSRMRTRNHFAAQRVRDAEVLSKLRVDRVLGLSCQV